MDLGGPTVTIVARTRYLLYVFLKNKKGMFFFLFSEKGIFFIFYNFNSIFHFIPLVFSFVMADLPHFFCLPSSHLPPNVFYPLHSLYSITETLFYCLAQVTATLPEIGL